MRGGSEGVGLSWGLGRECRPLLADPAEDPAERRFAKSSALTNPSISSRGLASRKSCERITSRARCVGTPAARARSINMSCARLGVAAC